MTDQKYTLSIPYCPMADDLPFHWLCFNMIDRFEMEDGNGATIIHFDHLEDKVEFILRWGEYLK